MTSQPGLSAPPPSNIPVDADDYPGVLFTLPDNSMRVIICRGLGAMPCWHLQERRHRPDSTPRWCLGFSARSRKAMMMGIDASAINSAEMLAFVAALPEKAPDCL